MITKFSEKENIALEFGKRNWLNIRQSRTIGDLTARRDWHFIKEKTGRISAMKIKILFAWYDFWIGLFWDRHRKRLYVFPIPCFGIMIDFRSPADRYFDVKWR